jgi:hypothetical protein
MSEASRKEQEERALDALLVSLLRKVDKDDDIIDPITLPDLTQEEKAAMNKLGDEFIDRILAGEAPIIRRETPENDDDCGEDAALAGTSADYAMNRAEEVDDDTAEELKRREQEILERKKKRDGT